MQMLHNSTLIKTQLEVCYSMIELTHYLLGISWAQKMGRVDVLIVQV
jgi:hypothetical protein